MMNLERERDRHIKLFSVKLKRELADFSDSDEAQDDANSKMYRMCFEFIPEVRLELDGQSFSAIQKLHTSGTHSPQPSNMLVCR